MGNIKKNMRVLKEMFYLRFHGLVVSRLDFFAPFFIDGVLFVVQLLAFKVVYSNVDKIGTWGHGEMVLYIGTFSLINAINMVVYFFGVNGIPSKIKSGELDLYLSKPVSPLFHLSFEKTSPGSLPLVAMGICIILYGVSILDVKPGIVQIMSYIFWILVMSVLYYDLEVIIRSVPLYTVSMARMEQIEEAGIDLCMKLPGTAFYGIYKVVFYLILPYGIMATLPVQSVINEMDLWTGVYGIFIVIIFSCITCATWKCGLKHYNSASS